MKSANAKRKTTKAAKLPSVEDMSTASIDSVPHDMDWTKGLDEEEGWECWEACRCGGCDAVVLGREGDQHRDVEHDSTCEGGLSGEGPMMSCWYPAAIAIDDVEAAARAIVDLPLCVVQVKGEMGLALTGGGMDLSWEICEAFLHLGMLPPVHFCRLPEMAGKDLESSKNRWIIEGALRSCAITASRAEGRAADLRQMVERATAAKRAV